MPSSVTLGRHVTLETVSVEEFLTLDSQGKPTYDTPVDIEVRVKREDKMTPRADGTFIQTVLTLWIPGDAVVLPEEQDRLTYASETFIGAVAKDVKDFSAQLTHRRLRCRRE